MVTHMRGKSIPDRFGVLLAMELDVVGSSVRGQRAWEEPLHEIRQAVSAHPGAVHPFVIGAGDNLVGVVADASAMCDIALMALDAPDDLLRVSIAIDLSRIPDALDERPSAQISRPLVDQLLQVAASRARKRDVRVGVGGRVPGALALDAAMQLLAGLHLERTGPQREIARLLIAGNTQQETANLAGRSVAKVRALARDGRVGQERLARTTISFLVDQALACPREELGL